MHTRTPVRHRIQTEIAEDYYNSASVLTARAIQILKEAALRCTEDDYAGCIADAAGQIATAKPSMAGLGTAARRFASQLGGTAHDAPEQSITDLTDSFLTELANAAQRAVVLAARMIPAKSSVLTCSYSSLALEVLTKVRPDTVLVYVPPGTYEEHGIRMAEELRECDRAIEVVREPLTDERFKTLSMAVVGADSVTPELVVNGSPTLEMAQAFQGHAPFYIVSERIKLTREVEVVPGYDRVPIELVTGIITEDGVLAPGILEQWVCLD